MPFKFKKGDEVVIISRHEIVTIHDYVSEDYPDNKYEIKTKDGWRWDVYEENLAFSTPLKEAKWKIENER